MWSVCRPRCGDEHEPLALRVPVRSKAWSIDHRQGDMRVVNVGVHVHVFNGGINGRAFV